MPRPRDDLGLLLVVLRVQDVMRDAPALQEPAHGLGRFHADGAHEHRYFEPVELRDLVHQRVVLLTARLEDHVVGVLAAHRLIRRDDDHVALVRMPELLRLRLRGARHAGQLRVEPEIILDRDRGEGLRLPLHPDVLLGLDRLMEPVRVAPARHEPAGELVHDEDLFFLHDVLHVFLVERIRAQELEDVVDALASLRVDPLQIALLRHLVRGLEGVVLVDRAQLGGEVGQEEEVPVALRQELPPLLGEIDGVILLVDRVVELLVRLPHALVPDQLQLHLLDEPLHPGLVGDKLPEPLVLRRPALHLQELEARLPFLLRILAHALGVREDPVHELPLRADEPLHVRLHLVVFLDAVLDRTRDDERRPRLVDEDRIHLVDDRVVMPALDAVIAMPRHVVAEVIESELVVGSVRDVAGVGGAPLREIHPVLDASDGEPEEGVDPPHPLAVAPGEIVVHRDEVDALSGKRVEVDGHRRDQRLALAGRHLGDLPFVEHHRAQELDVEGDHVPGDGNADHVPGLTDEAAAGLLHDRERHRQEVVFRLPGLEPGAEFRRLGLERFVGELAQARVVLVDLLDERPHALDVALVLRPEDA